MTNYMRGLELNEREKNGLLSNSVVFISFTEDGNYHEFVTSIGMMDAADIDWRSDKYRLFGVEVNDLTFNRLIGVSDPEPPRGTFWKDIHGGIWSWKNGGWEVDGTFMGPWPKIESAFPMERVKHVPNRATV